MTNSETVKVTLEQHSKGPFQVSVNCSWNAKTIKKKKVCYQGLREQEESPAFVSVVRLPLPETSPWGLVHVFTPMNLVGSAHAVWFSCDLPDCTLPGYTLLA